jgi:hypothetical protein
VAGNGTEGDRVRLAELVAALSLGIDLGFGQPMAGTEFVQFSPAHELVEVAAVMERNAQAMGFV